MIADVLLQGTDTVRVQGDLLAVDGRILVMGDALVFRIDGKDHVLSLRVLTVLTALADRGLLWAWAALPPDRKSLLGEEVLTEIPVPHLIDKPAVPDDVAETPTP